MVSPVGASAAGRSGGTVPRATTSNPALASRGCGFVLLFIPYEETTETGEPRGPVGTAASRPAQAITVVVFGLTARSAPVSSARSRFNILSVHFLTAHRACFEHGCVGHRHRRARRGMVPHRHRPLGPVRVPARLQDRGQRGDLRLVRGALRRCGDRQALAPGHARGRRGRPRGNSRRRAPNHAVRMDPPRAFPQTSSRPRSSTSHGGRAIRIGTERRSSTACSMRSGRTSTRPSAKSSATAWSPSSVISSRGTSCTG